MKKQVSEKTKSVRVNNNTVSSYLSLNRETYKPYLNIDDPEHVEKQEQDSDRIIKFAY